MTARNRAMVQLRTRSNPSSTESDDVPAFHRIFERSSFFRRKKASPMRILRNHRCPILLKREKVEKAATTREHLSRKVKRR